jgi:hypothetical protein
MTAVEMMEFLQENPIHEVGSGPDSEEPTQHYLRIVQSEYAKLNDEDKQRFANFVTVMNTQRYNFQGDLQQVLAQMPLWQIEQVAQRFKNYAQSQD